MNGKFHVSVFVMLAAMFLFSCALDFKIGKRDSWPEQDAPGEAADGLDVDVGEEIIIPPGCGNGVVDAGEECDSRDPVSCTTSCGITGEGSCSDTCTLPPASECSPLPGECCENADCIDVGECRQGACDGHVCVDVPVDDMTPCPGGICCGGECRAGADCCTNEDCPMGCKGTALECVFFDDLTCATQTGCFWSGGTEVCYGSGYSCLGFTNNETCSACGCFWPVEVTSCLGPVADCGSVSVRNCSTCGCNWGFPSCSGSLDCEMFSTQEGCESCGCLWFFNECYGTDPCSNIMDNDSCISCGCRVTPPCGGTHFPCNLYRSYADCATQLDCYWSVCDDYNCT